MQRQRPSDYVILSTENTMALFSLMKIIASPIQWFYRSKMERVLPENPPHGPINTCSSGKYQSFDAHKQHSAGAPRESIEQMFRQNWKAHLYETCAYEWSHRRVLQRPPIVRTCVADGLNLQFGTLLVWAPFFSALFSLQPWRRQRLPNDGLQSLVQRIFFIRFAHLTYCSGLNCPAMAPVLCIVTGVVSSIKSPSRRWVHFRWKHKWGPWYFIQASEFPF